MAVENDCESYHLPWVHPGLNGCSRLKDHYDIIEAGFSGQRMRAYRPLLSAHGSRLPHFADLACAWGEKAEHVALYPNLLLGVHKDHVLALRLDPLEVDRTAEHVAPRAFHGWVADRYRATGLDAA